MTFSNCIRSTAIVPALYAALVLGAISASPGAWSQSGPPDDPSNTRYCVLMAMLGTNLPPECSADDEADHSGALDHLRLATVAFHSADVARAAGWNAPISECVESPAGGMGFHVANLDYLADGGRLSLTQPEVLLYAPTADGSMEFLGVEYIIPGEDWTQAEPPEFLGRELHFNPVLEIWALHVWSARENPEGLFADFNPEISCEFAEE